VNQAEFQTQLTRLMNCYGKQHYNDERVTLIWREVSGFSVEWFGGVVDRMIGGSRYAPLVGDFYEAASIERERLNKVQKEKHAREAREFGTSVFSPDDRSMMIQTIIKRINGGVSDSDWNGFKRMVNSTVQNSSSKAHCLYCDDTGYEFYTRDGYEYARDCSCARRKRAS
jgi:hypothetical protein